MYRILLPIDSNVRRAERAAEAITELPGDPTEMSVTLLNVFRKFDVRDEGGHVSSDSLYDEEQFPESVDAAAAILEAAGITTVKRREHGQPTEHILSVAKETDSDLIVVSGRKRSPAGKALFGSVTQSVLLSAERPVLVTMDD